MKVIVADTSPINYLVLIDQVGLLTRLYGEVLIPDIVASELRDPHAPPTVSGWAAALPTWVIVRPTPDSSDRLERLDAGERAAILLAESQESPVLLLIDDADGREEAARRRIPTTGTLGILRAASIRGYLDLPKALARLKETNFRCAASLLDQLLEADRRNS